MVRFVLFLILALFAAGAAHADTLDLVRERGELRCGVALNLVSAQIDGAGNWHGLDAEFCRALTVAIFGDATKLRIVQVNPKVRFDALRDGEVDILFAEVTWTMGRELALGFEFPAVTFYDGQAFLAPSNVKAERLADLPKSSVCVQAGTTTETNLANYVKARQLDWTIVTLESQEGTISHFQSGLCELLTLDGSNAIGIQVELGRLGASGIRLLPDRISKEPLGPVVRGDDRKWRQIVRWLVYGLITAEELGVGKADPEGTSGGYAARRLLGFEPGPTEQLGLPPHWMVNVLRTVGNYGELFDRAVGAGSDFHMARGLNDLWSRGGLLYAPPM